MSRGEGGQQAVPGMHPDVKATIITMQQALVSIQAQLAASEAATMEAANVELSHKVLALTTVPGIIIASVLANRHEDEWEAR